MFESIARLILDLVMPMNLILIMFTAAIVFLLLKWYRASVYTGLTGFIILLITLTPVLPNLLVADLEGRYPVLNDPADLLLSGQPLTADTVAVREIHILVLGGGHSPDPWLPPTSRLSTRALGRLAEGIRLHRMIPESRLILSGWSSSGGESVAKVMGLAAVDLGVDSTRIHVLSEPSNTCREAQVYNREFGSRNPLILVTSASHMPRAMQLFRQTGLDPVPAPAGFRIKFHPDRRYFYLETDVSNISKMESAIKEYVGMVWGRWDCK
ncbi:MAG: ElyC/SanA/YdcF family protein [Cyclonatronaceae bacterium]